MSRRGRINAIAVAAAVVLIGALLGLRAAVTDAPLDRLTRTDAGWEGSWYFPRGGPYVLGFESPDGTGTLYIDGARLGTRPHARDKAFLHAWKVFDAGAHAVRLDAPAGSRLLWHPPGRRGPAEYVPASSLSPDAPASAQFSSPGTSRGDGVIALAIAAVVLGLIAALVRGWLAGLNRRVVVATAAAFAFALIVRVVGLNAAGQTWDEDTNWSAGRNYVTNVLSVDGDQASWRFNYEHPPVMKYVAGIGAQLSDGYGPSRLLSALMLALACALCVPIGNRLWSLRVGALAAGIAALTPHLIAHGKVVGHEAPAVLWWTLAVWLCLGAHARAGDSARRLAGQLAIVGVVVGLAVFSRFSNGLVAPLVGALLLLSAPAGQRLRTVGLGFAVIPAAALVVGFALWPRLWVTPVEHLREAWKILDSVHGAEPYLGRIVSTDKAPWHYFFVYLYATAPVGVLVAVALWGARLVHDRAAHWRRALCLAAWLAAPLLILLSPVKQDGVRYILPALMALAMAAAVGLDWLAARIPSRHAFTAVAGVFAVYLLVTAYRIHPYYLDYYGEHVGGPARVAQVKAFEIGWWGEGVDRAVAFVNAHAAAGDCVDRSKVVPSHITWLRGDLWRRCTFAQADWVLVNQINMHGWKPRPGDNLELAHEVRAQGAVLIRVYRRIVPPPSGGG